MSVANTTCIKPIPRPKRVISRGPCHPPTCTVQVLVEKRVEPKQEPSRIGLGLTSEETSVLTREEERHYLALAAKGDQAARNLLVERNLRLVAFVAKNYARSSDMFDELFAEGYNVLFHAIDRFDLAFETKFSTYATWWLRQSMSKYLGMKNGNGMASDFDLEEKECACKLESKEAVSMIRSCLFLLTDRERDVINRRFGIDCECETLDQIGGDYCLSKERIRQIEAKAMEKMRPVLSTLR